MTDSPSDRLRQARERAGFKSARQAAIRHRWTISTYASHENGQTIPPPRVVPDYARAFGVSPEWLMFGRGEPDAKGKPAAPAHEPPFHRAGTLMILGEVAAGIWKEAHADAFEPEPYDAPVDTRFPPEAQFLLRVKGASINRKVPNGGLVRCVRVYAVDAAMPGRQPRDGDWVIVQRTKNGFAECTVKQLRTVDGESMLFPDSTDPAHQDPIRVGKHDGDSVEIVAFVLDFINPATRL